MKKKVQMKKMAGVFLALAILGIGLFPPGNVYAAANQAPDADPVVVVLDPGHGGYDQGARYKWGGKTYKEKQLNLAIAKACKTELEKYAGVKVYMTRSSDRFVTLGNRVNFAKSRKADLFVAIHNNASLKKPTMEPVFIIRTAGIKKRWEVKEKWRQQVFRNSWWHLD